jgi:translation elongation factor P/translation initiation factor 5A
MSYLYQTNNTVSIISQEDYDWYKIYNKKFTDTLIPIFEDV